MDGYPRGSLDRNVPFLLASGLNATTNELPLRGDLKDQGILIRSELPPLESKEADVLEEHLEEVDAKGASWSGGERNEPYRFRVKTHGRSFLFPPRRARLPETIEPPESPAVLHSPFSPLSPASPLYHDGLIDVQWIEKHQMLVPSIFLGFYTLTSDPTVISLEDNRLKRDLGNIKGALVKSGYKTRLAAIILGDGENGPMSISEGIQERLEGIRKGAGLDPKSIFYIPPQETGEDLKGVIDNILSVLYVSAVEYYRDLGRHAKKKRSRGIVPHPTVPPTSGTSRTLSLSDWNFRYEFKSGVFAEFRQEAEGAMRSFEQAYEILLGQDVMDVIPSWSSRWNEARMLADIISIRCLRLHFWLDQHSLAVRRWQLHRDRLGDLVERRGRGTSNYGWHAWEARWATVMANVMEKVGIPGLAPSTRTLFLQPEKALLGERVHPWEFLHHTGYWYRLAARHLVARRTQAVAIPEEDRQPPDASPASQVAGKAYTYDTFMCPEPHQEVPLAGKGVNHSQLVIDSLAMARREFQARDQLRTAAEVSLECAKETAGQEKWQEVLMILRPLWEDMSFRSEEWVDVSEELSWLLRKAAAETGRADLVVAIDWELMSKRFTRQPQWHYDLSKALDGVSPSSRTSVTISDQTISSFISAGFVFRTKQSKAGETCQAQLSLSSAAMPNAKPICFSSLRVESQGALKPIVIDHEVSGDEEGAHDKKISISPVMLKEEVSKDSEDDLPSLLRGQCDLTLKPGQTRVFEMTIPLREPGEAEAVTLVVSYRNEAFDLDYSMKLSGPNPFTGWYVEGSSERKSARSGAQALHIQPRPPKMDIQLVDALSQYYANEPVELRVRLRNAEDESATVKLDVQLFGKRIPAFRVEAGGRQETGEAAPEESQIAGLPLGSIDSSSSLAVVLTIDPATTATTYDVHLRAAYHLDSDPATPIMQMLSIQLNVVSPFEANYDLVPRLHPDPWPSLFDCDNVQDPSEADKVSAKPMGFAQQWCLQCHYASFAMQDLEVVGLELEILACVGGARCDVVGGPELGEGGMVVTPRTMHEAQFELVAQKLSLDDRHPVSLDLGFTIRWRRQGTGDATVNTTRLPVGKYFMLGTEPRVLASVVAGRPSETSLMLLEVAVENPSNHFLTFGLSMEPSDEFAFSGAKQTTLHLLPMSRRTVRYRLLPLVRGAFVRPGLVVRDKYFQKVLRIIPTEGMNIDKDGLLVWVPGERGGEMEEEEEAGGKAGEEEASEIGAAGDGDGSGSR